MAKIDTVTLIKVAQEKLLEVQKDFEGDQKKLEQLITDRGALLAEKVTDPGFKDGGKIVALSKKIDALKTKISESGAPLQNALKAKILSLKSKAEREQKLEDEKQQNLVEEKMAKISKEFIPLLGKVDTMNSTLQELYATWKGLSEKSGRMIFDKKVSIGSEQMLNLVYGVLKNEWDGKGGKGRQFYNRIAL